MLNTMLSIVKAVSLRCGYIHSNDQDLDIVLMATASDAAEKHELGDCYLALTWSCCGAPMLFCDQCDECPA